jgi:hypothetical protein
MSSPVQIPWPLQALPGRRPGDGQGDLINAYATQIGDMVEIRRTPGLIKAIILPAPIDRIPRGMHALPDRLFHAWDGQMRVWQEGGDVAVVGAFPGSDRITMAHNMRDLGQNVVAVNQIGAYLIDLDTNTIAAYPDPFSNLTSVNSVEYFAGYFVFTKPDGYFVVSDLQSTDVPDLSYGKTEYQADVLYRAKATQTALLLMSSRSIEIWVDVATSPMPFTRQGTLDIGLIGPWAVAGGSNEWERGVYFVASDFTVRQMEGMQPKIISTDPFAFDVYTARDDIEGLVAQVYTFEQQAVFSLTSLKHGWTWEYNVSTGKWHRRDSYGLTHWRGTSATQFANLWIVQDLVAGQLHEVAQEVFEEDGERLRFRCESAPIKAFPASVRVPSIDIECIVGLGKTRVPSPWETDPCLMVSWSHDGGANWSRPVARSMGKVGRYANKVTVNNLGRSTGHGVRIRVDVVDPVPATILGGVSTAVRPSRARQVDK